MERGAEAQRVEAVLVVGRFGRVCGAVVWLLTVSWARRPEVSATWLCFLLAWRLETAATGC